MNVMPAAAFRSMTHDATTGEGTSRGVRSASIPLEAMSWAAVVANFSDNIRVSKPTTIRSTGVSCSRSVSRIACTTIRTRRKVSSRPMMPRHPEVPKRTISEDYHEEPQQPVSVPVSVSVPDEIWRFGTKGPSGHGNGDRDAHGMG